MSIYTVATAIVFAPLPAANIAPIECCADLAVENQTTLIETDRRTAKQPLRSLGAIAADTASPNVDAKISPLQLLAEHEIIFTPGTLSDQNLLWNAGFQPANEPPGGDVAGDVSGDVAGVAGASVEQTSNGDVTGGVSGSIGEAVQLPGDQNKEIAEDNTILVTGVQRDVVDNISIETFEVAQELDRALIAPVASFYDDVLPDPVRIAGRNFLSNLNEPVNIINFLLQFKIGKAIETTARFAINSSLGLGGIIDIAAKPGINLPHRRNGFANTMGFYGIKPGRYLYLPFIGPTTVRDLIGTTMDRLIVPVIYGPPVNDPIFGPVAGVATALDLRIENDEKIRVLQEESNDPFTSIKDDYLELRRREIAALRGRSVDAETPAATPQPAPAIIQPPAATASTPVDNSQTGEVEALPMETASEPQIIFVPGTGQTTSPEGG